MVYNPDNLETYKWLFSGNCELSLFIRSDVSWYAYKELLYSSPATQCHKVIMFGSNILQTERRDTIQSKTL